MNAPSMLGYGWLKHLLYHDEDAARLSLACMRARLSLGGSFPSNATRRVCQLYTVTRETVERASVIAGQPVPPPPIVEPSQPSFTDLVDMFEALADDTLDSILVPVLYDWDESSAVDSTIEDPRIILRQAPFWGLSLLNKRWSASCRRVRDALFCKLQHRLDVDLTSHTIRRLDTLFAATDRLPGTEWSLAVVVRLYERWCFSLLPLALVSGGTRKHGTDHPIVAHMAANGTSWLGRVAMTVRACYGLLTFRLSHTRDGTLVGYAAVTKDYNPNHARRLETVTESLDVGGNVAISMRLFTRLLASMAGTWARANPESGTNVANVLETLRARERVVRMEERDAGRRTRKMDMDAVLWRAAPDVYAHLAAAVCAALGV